MQRKIDEVKKNIYILSAVQISKSHRLSVFTCFLFYFYGQPRNYSPILVFFRMYY